MSKSKIDSSIVRLKRATQEIDQRAYNRAHYWIDKQNGRPTACEHCEVSGTDKKLQWANLSGQYKLELDDWIGLCSKCHIKMDQILLKSWQTRRENALKLDVLSEGIRTMNNRSDLYRTLKRELSVKGWWKNRPRGKPNKSINDNN